MSIIKPFKAIRPQTDYVADIAALPYDVYNTEEAKQVLIAQPLSFLAIDKPEIAFEEGVDPHHHKVYEKARDVLQSYINEGKMIVDGEAYLYLYELTMDGRSQTGVVCCTSVDEYLNNQIKKHENTRADKELDRINHVDYCDSNTGPIFLTYRSRPYINSIIEKIKINDQPLYDFVADDGIAHRIWCVKNLATMENLENDFLNVKALYIADGHHRAASAVKVAEMRRKATPGYTGDEEFNYFLSVVFPDDQLMIMDYNRVVTDLNGLSKDEFLKAVSQSFDILKESQQPIKPNRKGDFGMILNGNWYLIRGKKGTFVENDPVLSLDVSILQMNLLSPILNIGDPRVDHRIDFVGGIRGLEELKRRTLKDMAIGFSMYPTSIEELMNIADAGQLMPPKSTWFEPKLRSGLFVHSLK